MNPTKRLPSADRSCTRRTRFRTAAALALYLAVLATASSCGPSIPPPTAINALPAAGVGPGAIGIVKFDLTQLTEESVVRWLGFPSRAALDAGPALPRKLMMARDGLSELGLVSGVIVIPSLESVPEEMGVYLAGPTGLDREKIEDVFIKSGGLNIAGFSMASAFAKEVEPGWYFFGWGTDGFLDETDYGRAAQLSKELANAPAAPATLLLLADGSDLITPDMLPVDEGRTSRRLRALAEAASGMRSLIVSAGGDRSIEWRVGFESDAAADAARDAVSKVLGDVKLMAEGSIAVGELDEYDLLGWKRLADRAEITSQASAIVLRPAKQ